MIISQASSLDPETSVCDGVNHGFYNDTTPRYDEEAAMLAQERTIAFLDEHLRG